MTQDGPLRRLLTVLGAVFCSVGDLGQLKGKSLFWRFFAGESTGFLNKCNSLFLTIVKLKQTRKINAD